MKPEKEKDNQIDMQKFTEDVNKCCEDVAKVLEGKRLDVARETLLRLFAYTLSGLNGKKPSREKVRGYLLQRVPRMIEIVEEFWGQREDRLKLN